MHNLNTVAIWLIKKLCIDPNATSAIYKTDITHLGKHLGKYKITIEKI